MVASWKYESVPSPWGEVAVVWRVGGEEGVVKVAESSCRAKKTVRKGFGNGGSPASSGRIPRPSACSAPISNAP